MFINLRWVVCASLAVSSMVGADAGLLSMVMPEANVVAGIDVVRAKNSTFGQFVLRNLSNEHKDLEKLALSTGFDPRRDLQEVLFASADPRGKSSKGLIVARGTFSPSRLTAALREQGMEVGQTIAGVEVYEKKGSSGAFAFLENGLLVMGEGAAVRGAISRRQAPAALSQPTLDKVQSLSRDNDIWMVTTLPVSEMAEKVPGRAPGSQTMSGMMKGDAFRGIEQAAMGIQFAANLLNVTLEAAARSTADAAALTDVVRFLASMVQLKSNGGELSGLATAMETMKLTTTDNQVRMTMSVPQTEVEKLILKRKAKTRRTA